MDGNTEFWKKKYEDSEKNLQTLKDLAHKGVADYEQLKKKYDQNYKQYEELKAELEDTREKLASFEHYAKDAVNEFDQLEKKYELEHCLVQEVSNYASQVTKQKNKLHRQSQALLDKFGGQLSIPDLKDITEETDNDSSGGENGLSVEQKQLLARIESLQEDVASLDVRLKHSDQERSEAVENYQHVTSKLEVEKQRVHRLEICVKEHQRSLQKFQRVSLLAIQEHEELQSKFVLEKDLKDAVVKEAQKIESERKMVVRQSAAAILEASADVKLRKAFENIEELSKKLTDTEIKLRDKENELTEATDKSDHLHSINELQQRLDEAIDENKKLDTQIKDQAKWNEKLTKDYAQLEKKLDEVESRFVPPPPPPPPPPPAVLRPILKLLKKGKKPMAHGGNDKPPEFQKALEELMAKIKRGDALPGSMRGGVSRSRGEIPFERLKSETQTSSTKVPSRSLLRTSVTVDESTRQPSVNSENSAMHEMQTMLKRIAFKKSYSESDGPKSPISPELQFDGALAEAFKRVRGDRKTLPEKEENEHEEVFSV